MSKSIYEKHKHLPYIMRIRKTAQERHQQQYNKALTIIIILYVLLLIAVFTITQTK